MKNLKPNIASHKKEWSKPTLEELSISKTANGRAGGEDDANYAAGDGIS